jgi:sugar (pentulose or hexulose) kinase
MPDRDRNEAGRIAVLDNGKTNLKISVATQDGVVIESVSLPNTVLAGPPWRHHDLAGLGDWALEQLADLSRRHLIGHIVPVGHGSGGVLVGNDPEADGGGAALPMIDYEQPLPPGIADAYALQSGTFQDRGSAIMMASTHQARQMLWMERDYPTEFAGARFLLGVPQYWAWRLSGVAASETSYLGAQSHLWNVPEKRLSPPPGRCSDLCVPDRGSASASGATLWFTPARTIPAPTSIVSRPLAWTDFRCCRPAPGLSPSVAAPASRRSTRRAA